MDEAEHNINSSSIDSGRSRTAAASTTTGTSNKLTQQTNEYYSTNAPPPPQGSHKNTLQATIQSYYVSETSYPKP